MKGKGRDRKGKAESHDEGKGQKRRKSESHDEWKGEGQKSRVTWMQNYVRFSTNMRGKTSVKTKLAMERKW